MAEHPVLFMAGIILITGFVPVMLGGAAASTFIPNRHVKCFLNVFLNVFLAFVVSLAVVAFILIAISSVQF